jgi:phospholipid transport system substrate-binding protein
MHPLHSRRGVLLATIAVAAAPLAPAQPAGAAPTDAEARVNAFYAALLDTMKQAKQLGTKGRYERLFPVIVDTFDVPGMTRLAAGAAWQAASPAQQAEMTDAFSRLMAATYAARFDDFAGERFEIAAAVDQPPGNKLVRTRLVQSNGKIYNLNYLMRAAGGGWKIADVYLDGTISELAARRAEFASIIKGGGPDALVALLRERADKLLVGS